VANMLSILIIKAKDNVEIRGVIPHLMDDGLPISCIFTSYNPIFGPLLYGESEEH